MLDRHELILPPSATTEPRPFIDSTMRIDGIGTGIVNFDTEILDLIESEDLSISKREKSFFARF